LVFDHKIRLMRPVVFGEALPAGTRLTLFSADKPDRFFTVIEFWIDKTSGVALELNTGVPSYQVDDEEGRTHLLIHLPIEPTNIDGVSGGRILPALIRGRSSTVPYLKNREEMIGSLSGFEQLIPKKAPKGRLERVLRTCRYP
jgi:hypothetical protein